MKGGEIVVHLTAEQYTDLQGHIVEAEHNLQAWLPELGAVLMAAVMEALRTTLDELQSAEKLLTDAVGGSEERARVEREVYL